MLNKHQCMEETGTDTIAAPVLTSKTVCVSIYLSIDNEHILTNFSPSSGMEKVVYDLYDVT